MIGGGLAGVEAAYHLADIGISVDLYEMRPAIMTEAHKSAHLAEIVCSNSFKGTDPSTAHGMLKKEMRALGSIILEIADKTRVPAGKALAVDRESFARSVTDTIESHKNITLHRKEISIIDTETPTVIATGPLTSQGLAEQLTKITGSNTMFFYDAISPIIDADTIDMDRAFFGSRWEPENTDYLNCPMDEALYEAFINELLDSDRVNARDFEDARFFDACLPVEVIASRGRDSLRFGPMRPVGFKDPATYKRPCAVVQLRRENLKGDAYNIVGFQTRLTYPEQKRIFGMIPALKNAEFLRYGSIHRNTFFDSPRILNKDLTVKGQNNLFLAGQITGVEGYMESAAAGIMAALSMKARFSGQTLSPPGTDTAIGALIHHITDPEIKDFQPMNINFGIMDSPDVHKRIRKQARLEREASSFSAWLDSLSGPA